MSEYEGKHTENLHKELHHKEPYHAHVTEAQTAKQDPPKPTVGQIVHYVLEDGLNKGKHRPAIVVNDWHGSTRINLQVFTDGSNDGQLYKSGLYWATSVPYAPPSENKPFSWHNIIEG
jgi:hypothetical protein